MQADIGSIAKFIMTKCEKDFKATAYFENIKDGFKVPAIYFPLPKRNIYKSSISCGFVYENSMFLQIFAMSNDVANRIANVIATFILKNNGYIPLLDENGNPTDEIIHVRIVSVSRIEDSISQVHLEWDFFCDYSDEEVDKIREIQYDLTIGGNNQ